MRDPGKSQAPTLVMGGSIKVRGGDLVIIDEFQSLQRAMVRSLVKLAVKWAVTAPQAPAPRPWLRAKKGRAHQ